MSNYSLHCYQMALRLVIRSQATAMVYCVFSMEQNNMVSLSLQTYWIR